MLAIGVGQANAATAEKLYLFNWSQNMNPALLKAFEKKYHLNAKIGAKLSNWNSYTSPNAASQPLLNKELQQPPIMPTKVQLQRLHYTPAIAGDQLQFVQQLWTSVQAQ
ncbi:MAG: hypothetical protein PF501_02490 [Salinisphaera sp.]|nr:hypothetical protein [Salinisphaera sp.]